MSQEISKPKVAVAAALALWVAAPFLPSIDAAYAQAAAAFDGLAGKWAGEGSIALANGSTERLRCNATYAVSGGGADLDLALLCASDSYNFDLRISLVDTAGQVVGNWNEVSKSVQGGISGQDAKGLIRVVARGQAFTAAVTVKTHGAQQSVAIHADSGDLTQVAITLHRGR